MAVFAAVQAHGELASNLLEKTLAFPPPVQWRAGGVEISLIAVAWGPADSPGMISKGREDIHVKKPEFYADRPFVLALGFRAKVPNVISTEMHTSSGLVRVKNVDGDIEAPMELTPSGFVPYSGSPGTFDVHFNRSGTAEYWDMFPVSPAEKEFLFEVVSGSGDLKLSFRIIRKDDDFVIIHALPGAETCLNFKKNFAGTVGPGSRVTVQLTLEKETVSGSEQYLRVGKTLWLQGTADSLGNFVVEERYPKENVTGIFKGKISQDCRAIRGLFSKPDGSALQPFELHEAGAVPRPDANQSDPERR